MAMRTRCPSCSTSATAKSWWTPAPTHITPSLSWRRYFRSTLAHNTVGIDERRPVGAGRQFHVDAITRRHAASNSRPVPSGSDSSANTTDTSGFADPVVHRREIVHDARRQVIEVTDMLRCDGEHRARRSWHFAEDCAGGTRRQRPQGHHRRARRCFFEPREALDSIEVHRGGGRGTGRLGVAQLRAQAAVHDGALAFAHFGCHGAAHAHRIHEGTRLWPLIPRSLDRPAPGRDRRRAER